MLSIAICDDQPQELEIINEYIKEYININALDSEMKLFSHPDKLLTTIETDSFHLYILDIVMPLLSGIEIGKEIRRHDHEAKIIYVTTEPQFALQAYAASPMNYLIKPIDKLKLFDTLTFAISKIELSEERSVMVKTAESMRIINLADLICCEYRSHVIIFTLTNGEEIISSTIRESFGEYILHILKDTRFLRCHASYIINMRRVECFAKDSFTLRGGKVVPIASKQYQTVREQFMNFLMAREVRK